MRRQVMIVLAMVGMALIAPAFSQQVTLDPKAYLAKAKPTWNLYDWCSAQSERKCRQTVRHAPPRNAKESALDRNS